MQAGEYERMRLHEETYWWYAGLRKLIKSSIKQSGEDASILDAGCGTGGNLRVLSESLRTKRLIGVDISPDAIRFAQERRIAFLARASVNQLPFVDELFDMIICMDVLYAMGVDEKKSIAELLRVLKKDGKLLLNLPAFEFLRGPHDVTVGTERRYTTRSARKILEQAGFQIEKLHYWNSFLFPFLVPWRVFGRTFGRSENARSDIRPLPAFVNRFLQWTITSEVELQQHIHIPFGSSIFVVARK
jgi:Methylase involved in ubiquinone/menaquinone biosynthesis